MKSVFIMDLTSEQVRRYLEREDAVIVPVGSCEQHGAHCRLGTDTFITVEISRRIAETLGFLVAPTIPVGLSDQHLAFPGSISFGVTTIRGILMDVAGSLYPQGFRRYIFHYFHTKNKIAVDAAAWEVKKEYGNRIKVMVVNSFASLQTCAGEIPEAAVDPLWAAHGGMAETACMMALGMEIPSDKIPEACENSEFLKITRSAEAYSVVQDIGRYVPGGTWGNPAAATKATGEKIFAAVSRRLSELIPGQWEN